MDCKYVSNHNAIDDQKCSFHKSMRVKVIWELKNNQEKKGGEG